ncbi:sensor histidine kinase [Bordetella pseudohinzii]|uniref:sensor histidine kinase n=1 Tax=Bordetella pseudohinzii TaxID=1331258 RepID=UPI00191810C7|nr:sensor histidine kinase [Bordetella pseudohinzii]
MKTRDTPAARTLRATLLLWLIPALVTILVAGLWLSNQQLREQVDIAYDRALAGALRSIDHNISTASGGLSLELPYLMLEFFELTANGSVYYRVATEDGLAEIGNPDLPMPDHPLQSGKPEFFYANYEGQPLRVAALARPMDPPLYANQGGRVIVQVAEGLETREDFLNRALLRSVGRDVALLLISVLAVIWSVLMALRPLERLRDEVASRSADDLSPISASDVPGEVLPLLEAINLHTGRFEAQARVQRQFLDDASHQLRTPLSVLRTQTAYALRETDPQEIHAALLAMKEGLDRAVRTTNQMLTLARAKDAPWAEGGLPLETVDLAELADSVSRSLLPAIRMKRIDFGLERPAEPVRIQAAEGLLREALSNLLDNALRYSPAGSEVTIRVGSGQGQAWICVEDAGPGMSPEDIAHASVRFRRGAAGKNKPGAGLGLAIVGTIVGLHGGTLKLENREPGPGLRATLVFSLGFTADAALQQKNGQT